MKTLLLSFLTFVSLSSLTAQFEMAALTGTPSFDPGYRAPTTLSKSEPAISAFAYTVNDMALINLGAGFKQPVNLQVLSPDMDVVVNRQIAAGQTNVKVDLAGLGEGTYIVRVRLGDRTFVRQVLKK
jgi:hypothetical protein